MLKNQAHPRNLVAVKKTGTPVVATPSLNAKPSVSATEHDEFEMLDFNTDWVHVRISGLSRGWIWRTSLEMPEGRRTFRWPARKPHPLPPICFKSPARKPVHSRGIGKHCGGKCENHLGAKNPGGRKECWCAR